MDLATATRRLIAAFLAGCTVGFGSPTPAYSQAAGTMPRIRSSSQSLDELIANATKQSSTFFSLSDAIHATDGIVYVEAATCTQDVPACLAGITPAGPFRMLWIKVDVARAECDLVASIGHELRHAVEVLNANVRTSAEMYLFYSRNARRISQRDDVRDSGSHRCG